MSDSTWELIVFELVGVALPTLIIAVALALVAMRNRRLRTQPAIVRLRAQRAPAHARTAIARRRKAPVARSVTS